MVDAGDVTTAKLDHMEVILLMRLEAVVEEGQLVFIEVGQALATIRDKRLYREGYATFEEYISDRWAITDRRARQLIAGARTAIELRDATGIVPKHERHIRDLSKLSYFERVKLWREVVENARAKKRSVTSKDVFEAVRRRDGAKNRAREAREERRRAEEEVEARAEEEGPVQGWQAYYDALCDVPIPTYPDAPRPSASVRAALMIHEEVLRKLRTEWGTNNT